MGYPSLPIPTWKKSMPCFKTRKPQTVYPTPFTLLAEAQAAFFPATTHTVSGMN
jgi:hypothetical protein